MRLLMSKKRILFVVDVKDWAYADRALNWKHMLAGEYSIDILHLADHPVGRASPEYMASYRGLIGDTLYGEGFDQELFRMMLKRPENLAYDRGGNSLLPVFSHKKYDGIVFFYHRAIHDNRLLSTFFPMDKVAICVNNEKWAEDGAQYTHDVYFKGSKVLVGCNKRIINSFKGIHPKTMRASQSVNSKIFFNKRKRFHSDRMKKNFVVGWSGRASNPIKNIDIVKSVCREAGVKLRVATNLTREELNTWYNNIDAVICASDSEGGPLMLLEAGAVGLPVISTPVGLAKEVIKSSKSGFIANHGDKAKMVRIVKRLSEDLELRESIGKEINKKVLTEWTYQARGYEIRNVLEYLCR
jgi:hypothetical protein